jgi:hypothetical protein
MKNIILESEDKESTCSAFTIHDHVKAMGFETQFITTEQGIVSLKTQKVFQSFDIKEVNFYKFNDESNSTGNSNICTIEVNNGEKGILVDGHNIHCGSPDACSSHHPEIIK